MPVFFYSKLVWKFGNFFSVILEILFSGFHRGSRDGTGFLDWVSQTTSVTGTASKSRHATTGRACPVSPYDSFSKSGNFHRIRISLRFFSDFFFTGEWPLFSQFQFSGNFFGDSTSRMIVAMLSVMKRQTNKALRIDVSMNISMDGWRCSLRHSIVTTAAIPTVFT